MTFLANTLLDGDAFDAAYDHTCDALGVSSLSARHFAGQGTAGVVVMRCHHAERPFRLAPIVCAETSA